MPIHHEQNRPEKSGEGQGSMVLTCFLFCSFTISIEKPRQILSTAGGAIQLNDRRRGQNGWYDSLSSILSSYFSNLLWHFRGYLFNRDGGGRSLRFKNIPERFGWS